jgi:GNAT superfamily N-acetyltransferase
MTYLTIPLSSSHRREDFSCGKDPLDNYLHKQVSQDIKRKLAACFVLPGEKNQMKGYYTLSNDSIPAKYIPDEIRKKMPQAYTNLPTTLLGRLAVDKSELGKGVGKLMLIDALNRAYEISAHVGSMAVIVDPIDSEAEAFYRKYGFIKLPDSGRMFLPMKTIAALFTSN